MTAASDRRWQRWALDGAPLALLALVCFVDLFLPWTSTCGFFAQPALVPPVPRGTQLPYCISTAAQNGLGGSGYGAAVLALAVVGFEGMRMARLALPISLAYRSLISAALTFGLLLFTILDLIPSFGPLVSHPGSMPFAGSFAWVALVLALAVAGGGVIHWTIWQSWAPAGPVPPAPPPAEPGRCPACGKRNAAGAVFCAYCGRPLGS